MTARFAVAVARLGIFWHMEPANWRGCWGQTETATLSGILQDPKGGVVPDVEVTATRIETGTVSTTKTNGAGI